MARTASIRRGPRGRSGYSASQVARLEQLTKRQLEVALLIAQGKFNAEIADQLECSIKTVDTHRGMVLVRLGLRNNVELTLLAIRQGLIPDPIHLANYAELFARHDAYTPPEPAPPAPDLT